MVLARMEDKKLEIKTSSEGRGHPLVLHQAQSSIVPSTDASTATLNRRAADLTRIAESVCGGSEGVRVQIIAGLKRLSADA